MQITLRAARTNKGFSQKEAAKRIGISEYTLSNYERGVSYPDIPILKRIEDVYGIAYVELVFLPNKCGLTAETASLT